MVMCKKCGRDISDEVKTCPFCGAPREKPKSSLVFWVFVILGVGFVVVLAAREPNRAVQDHSIPPQTMDQRAYELCLSELASADRARNGTGNFIAGTCEMMRKKYIEKYRSTP